MKGQIRVIEAVISVVILAVIVFLLTRTPPQSPDITKLNYKIAVWNALSILDNAGSLRSDALAGNAEKIQDELKPYLLVNYKVVLFNSTSNINPIPTINAWDVAVTSYFIAGAAGTYKPMEIRVYLWGFK